MDQTIIPAIKIEHVSKQYRLGTIGGTTLRAEMQRVQAKLLHKEDPTLKIGKERVDSNEKFWALRDISIEVKKGEALGIIGHNGAGKSTLLKLLCRVTAPTEGTISYDGRIASMLEVGTGFHPELTGRENIYLNGAILGMTKEEIDRKIEDIIDFSECRQFIDTPVKRYSSGMYVKLAFSVAAHLDSEIMIMDEVLAVGDMQFQKKCLNKMKEAASQEGRTVLYVSHNMNTIRQLCDRCIVLNKGTIEYQGDVDTAIEIYLGLVGKLACHYDYGPEFHANHNNSEVLSICSMDIMDKEESRYALNEPIHFSLLFHSKKQLTDIKIRFEIQYQDGTLAGTSLLDQTLTFNADEDKKIECWFLPKSLAPGKYHADIVAYSYNDLGIEQFMDGVYPGFVFEIAEDVDEDNELLWNHRYWGHVRLDDIQLVNKNAHK